MACFTFRCVVCVIQLRIQAGDRNERKSTRENADRRYRRLHSQDGEGNRMVFRSADTGPRTSTDEFILSTLPENNFRPQVWKRTFGLNDEQVFFFSYHLKADEEHAGQEVWGPILRHVRNDADRDEIFSGLISTLNAVKLF